MTESEYLFRAETHQIIGCSMGVINELGHGFHEKIYENSLVVEFGPKIFLSSNNRNIRLSTKRQMLASTFLT